MRRFLIAIIFLCLVTAVAFLVEQWSFFAPGPRALHGAATIVWIKPGERSAQIAQSLQQAGVIRNATLFRFGVRLRRKNADLKAGEYGVPSAASMADVMGVLISGKSIQHKLTAAEGLTSQMIYDIVRKDPVLVDSAGAVPEEGALLPETYLFVRGTTRSQVLARMMRAQKRLMAELWPRRVRNLPFSRPEQAIILASIVEKETAIPEERRHIAAVFINRLRLGMKLQSDPTIIYGITKGYPLGRRILESEVTGATQYNTYVINGLPPTPICNPGKNAIAAVLQPEPSADLYFVANGTGGHVFTPSIIEHERNVARWRQIERASQQADGRPSASVSNTPPPMPTTPALRGKVASGPQQPPVTIRGSVRRIRRRVRHR